MDKTIDLRQALLAFQTIRELGRPQNHSFLFGGLEAISDFDGYNISIKDDYVSLDIYFHSKYKLIFQNQQALLKFRAKLETIGRLQKTRKAGLVNLAEASSKQTNLRQ